MTVFHGSLLNPMSLTCGLITVKATPGKEPGKVHAIDVKTLTNK